MPFYTALVVGLVLLYVAYAAYREGERRRALWGLASAGVLLLWAFAFGRGLRLLPYPEVHGFSLALVGVILAAVWQMSGYTMALYLAGLRGIPVEVLGPPGWTGRASGSSSAGSSFPCSPPSPFRP